MEISQLTAEQLLSLKEKIEVSSGKKVTGKEYLDLAINALNLNQCDYFTVLYILKKGAERNKNDDIVKEIKQFWKELFRKYGR